MKLWRNSIHPSGKAELGLLAALLIFFGAAAGAVWMVLLNGHGSEKPDEAEARADHSAVPSSPVLNKARRKVEARKPAVTIVADSRAQAALQSLRPNLQSDGKPRRPPPPAVDKKVAASPAAQLDVDGEVIDREAPEVKQAVNLLNTYLASKSWQEKLSIIHQPGQARPLLEEFYGSQGSTDPGLSGLVSASNLKIGNRAVLTLSFSSVERLNKMVHASFWRGPDGLRLDWESFVGFSGKSMGTFRAGHCSTPTVFRVLAVTDDYYNFEFTDAKKYLSLRLYAPDGEDYLHGYCMRDGLDGRKLVEVLGNTYDPTRSLAGGNGLQPHPASRHFPITVELAFPENAQSDRCVKIEKFVSPWWLALDAEKQTTASLDAENPGSAAVR